ncbi:hypothetical protein [Shewanella sp. NIFS-20-20]|uniref:hypothetical protein n=1 Tax=Shewanella sp. NIFS-20-20 TaxID=2853806 RepID=UPI002109CA4E|nr:hypothetical protein [Shewanella sp. NIFS-20-20]
MKSAKEFARWLLERLSQYQEGVYLTRSDILELTDRQRFAQDYVTDIHFEVAQFGMGFVTDANRESFYFFKLPKTHWKTVGDIYPSEDNEIPTVDHKVQPIKQFKQD